MLERYGICQECHDFIESRGGIWFDLEDKATRLHVSDLNAITWHFHLPMAESDYKRGRCTNLKTEILLYLGIMGLSYTSLGNSDDFGYFEFFPEYNAILQNDSQGFVYSTIYETERAATNAWEHISADYDEYCDERDYREQQELEYERRDIDAEYDEYDSDLWDIRS